MLNIYNNLLTNNKKIKEITQKKERLLELYLSNNISKEDFITKNDLYTEKNIELKKVSENISKIKENINKKLLFQEPHEFINLLINKIYIESQNNNRNCIKLLIYLNIETSLSHFKYNSKEKKYYIKFLYNNCIN